VWRWTRMIVEDVTRSELHRSFPKAGDGWRIALKLWAANQRFLAPLAWKASGRHMLAAGQLFVATDADHQTEEEVPNNRTCGATPLRQGKSAC